MVQFIAVFIFVANITVRFPVFVYPTVQVASVFEHQGSYGAVWCGFHNFSKIYYGAVRRFHVSYSRVWVGF